MEQAKAKADALEAELQELLHEEAEVQAEAEDAEQKAAEAERLLTERSATMLSEYASKHEDKSRLEAQLAEGRAKLDAVRASNLELSRRNLALDREDRQLRDAVAEAEALLQQCENSQGDLNGTLIQEQEACAKAREAAGDLAKRFATDLARLEAMRTRLAEVSEGGTDETRRLLTEAESVLKQTREARDKCQLIHEMCGKPAEDSEEVDVDVALPVRQPHAEGGA